MFPSVQLEDIKINNPELSLFCPTLSKVQKESDSAMKGNSLVLLFHPSTHISYSYKYYVTYRKMLHFYFR